ncbi:MAG: heat-inducible transcriptional repressor HrcA [Alphaproteobacteria bacterium]
MTQSFSLSDLDQRSRDVFRTIVDSYLATGEPVGSRTLSRSLPIALSPATIRNVMSDLESLGLLCAPHVSAGRLPTETGLRLFVDGLLEVGDLTGEERASIEARVGGSGRDVEEVLTEATTLLSGLSHCAGLVVAPKRNAGLKHIEFVPLGPTQALVVLVSEDGQVENRVINTPMGLPASALSEATNYLNAQLRGRTLGEARDRIVNDMASKRAELDTLTARVIEAGLATWSGAGHGAPDAAASDPTGPDAAGASGKYLIVRGQSHLLEDLSAAEDLERVRQLFDDLEREQDVVRLLELAERGEGVRIFIGSENKLFSLSGSSVIVSPYRDGQQRIVGVIGIVGPKRLNYARVIPMVDYTAKVVGRLLS